MTQTPTRWVILTDHPDLTPDGDCLPFTVYPADDDWCEIGDHPLTEGEAFHPSEGGAPPCCAACLAPGTLREVTEAQAEALTTWPVGEGQPDWREVIGA